VLKDVCNHQKALLNLGSGDVSYALRALRTLYVEQKDLRGGSAHLKRHIDDTGTSNTTRNENPGMQARGGASYGRTYDLKANQPAFINPSSEPLIASLKLQDRIEDSIRKLVNLAVQNKTGQRAIAAEAIKLSDQGLEAGLSYIGLALEGAERAVAKYWAAYENRSPDKRQVAVIKYPDRYSLRNDVDRVNEAERLAQLMFTVPGREVKKELSKNIVNTLLSGTVNVDQLDVINKEIDDADYATSDPDIIMRSKEAGLVGDKVASEALGFGSEEYLQAREDHATRLAAILASQTKASDAGASDAGARGVSDLGDKDESKQEKVDKPKRGEGKSLDKEE
jgi:hypothetical protein